MNKKDLKILVVDDSGPIRNGVGGLLELLGYSEADEAIDGGEALEILRGGAQFHCVITDINMPGMSGLELLQEIKDDPALRYIEVLVMSSISPEHRIVRLLLDEGALGYIHKPFDRATLKLKMDLVLAKLAAAG